MKARFQSGRVKTFVENNDNKKEDRKNDSLSSDSFTSDKSLVGRSGNDESIISGQSARRINRAEILQQIKDKALLKMYEEK